MLQQGVSRDLFEMWCSNKRNGMVLCLYTALTLTLTLILTLGVVLCGYTVEGTLAHHLLTEPKEIQKKDGSTVPCNSQIYTPGQPYTLNTER